MINIISFFGVSDIQGDNEKDRIEIAVSDSPAGPYKDLLGKPLINKFHNATQHINRSAFKDKNGQYYLFYGRRKYFNTAKLNDSFTGYIVFEDDSTLKEITPEGPFVFLRNCKYYLMWSEGGWTDPDYSVAYAVAD